MGSGLTWPSWLHQPSFTQQTPAPNCAPAGKHPLALAQSMDEHQHGGQLLTLPLTPILQGGPLVPPAPAPSSLPVQPVVAFPVDAGIAVALIHFGQALGVMEALGAEAGEAIDAILARAPVVAGVAGALVNVDVAHAACERGGGEETLPHRMHGTARHGGCVPPPRGHPPGRTPSSHPGNVCRRLKSPGTCVLAVWEQAALRVG